MQDPIRPSSTPTPETLAEIVQAFRDLMRHPPYLTRARESVARWLGDCLDKLALHDEVLERQQECVDGGQQDRASACTVAPRMPFPLPRLAAVQAADDGDEGGEGQPIASDSIEQSFQQELRRRRSEPLSLVEKYTLLAAISDTQPGCPLSILADAVGLLPTPPAEPHENAERAAYLLKRGARDILRRLRIGARRLVKGLPRHNVDWIETLTGPRIVAAASPSASGEDLAMIAHALGDVIRDLRPEPGEDERAYEGEWRPPCGYVNTSRIKHDPRFQKAGQVVPDSTLHGLWRKKSKKRRRPVDVVVAEAPASGATAPPRSTDEGVESTVYAVADPATGEIWYPTWWVTWQISLWNPRAKQCET